MTPIARHLAGGVLLALLPLIAFACGDSTGPAYVALGDSLAAGTGADDPQTEGYPAVFHAWLQDNYNDDIELHNFGIGGETSASIRESGQLERALDFIESRNADDDPDNDVTVISIDIGGNDLREPTDPGGPCAPPNELTARACGDVLSTAISTFQERFPVILREIREAAGPDAVLLVATYYNPYSGSGGPFDLDETDAVLGGFNEFIVEAAQDGEIGGLAADFFTPFDGNSLTLTGLGSPAEDFHPNTQGHRRMAEALIEAFENR